MTKTTLMFALLGFAFTQLCILGFIWKKQRQPQTETTVKGLKRLDQISRTLQIFAFSVLLIMILKGVV